MLEVELDAFSGQPNPRWDLTREQTTAFRARLRQLQPIQDGQIRGTGLGYRGFVVRTKGEPAGVDEVRLYRGTVLVQRGDRTQTLGDPERGLERSLLESARAHISEAVLAHIRSEVGH